MDMQFLNDGLTWMKAHPMIVSEILFLALNVANGLAKSSNESASAIGKFFSVLLDRLSCTTNKDAPGTFKMPGRRSVANGLRIVPPRLPVTPSLSPARRVAAKKLVMLFACASLINVSGCACWGEKANTKACIILKQVIDCSVGVGKDVVAHLIPTILVMVGGGKATFDSVLEALKSGGFENVGCIMAALEKDLMSSQNPRAQAFVLQARAYRGGQRYKLEGKVYP